eukprot:311379-Chlamydomonas_euryale.AAC.7
MQSSNAACMEPIRQMRPIRTMEPTEPVETMEWFCHSAHEMTSAGTFWDARRAAGPHGLVSCNTSVLSAHCLPNASVREHVHPPAVWQLLLDADTRRNRSLVVSGLLADRRPDYKSRGDAPSGVSLQASSARAVGGGTRRRAAVQPRSPLSCWACAVRRGGWCGVGHTTHSFDSRNVKLKGTAAALVSAERTGLRTQPAASSRGVFIMLEAGWTQ